MSAAASSPRWRAALGVQMLLVQVAWVGIRIMLGYRAIELGADAAFVAVLASAFAAPALAGSVVVGRLADRFGGALVTLIGAVLTAIGCFAPMVSPQPWLLLASAAIAGLGSVGIFVGQQAFVAHRTRGQRSDGDFGNLATIGSVGQLVAPPLVTVAASITAAPGRTDSAIGLLLCGIAAVFALVPTVQLCSVDRAASAPRALEGRSAGAIGVLRTPGLWRAIAVSSAMLVTMDLLYTFVPLWAADRGIDATVVGWLLALRAVVSVVSRLGLGRLVEWFGRKAPLVLSMGAGAVALAVLPFSGIGAAAAVMVGLGICLGAPQPLTLAWIVEIVELRDHGAALGMRMAGNRFAQTVIPLGMTAIAAPLGVTGVIWANALILAIATGLAAGSSPGGPAARQFLRR